MALIYLVAGLVPARNPAFGRTSLSCYAMLSMIEVKVSEHGAERLRAGLPWVYAPDVLAGNTDADVVRVVDRRHVLLGTALYARGARLPIRLLGREALELDDQLLRQRLGRALALRQRLFANADAYRLVHGEADGLPGLFVDRYADVAVVQTTARAMDAREPAIARLLTELIGVRLVVARDDGSARDFEALPRKKEILVGEGATKVRYHDAGNEVEVDVLTDGKTGGFLDQVENHAHAARYARGEALDAFTYHGGFALALARGGAERVLALDESQAAIARTRDNAAQNGLSQVTAECANAFDRLRALEAEGRRFDVVVVDPPGLAKRKSATGAAERAYKELNLRGLRLLKKEGILVSCSCSQRLTPERFAQVIESAVRDVGRPVQLLERHGAGRDHPPLIGLPETEYLKCWILRVLE
jgi:23S rRNA (cytosine1962-C5)-methyltransferase